MKVALINPPFVFPVTEQISHSQILGLRYLSAYLKSRGHHRVEIWDALHLGFGQVRKYYDGYQVGLEPEDLVSRISGDTDLIGVSVPFSQLAPIAHQIVAAAKAHLPRVPIILGGVYASSQPELALTSGADWILVGEGEEALYRIAAGENPEEIRGIYSRQGTLKPPFVPTDHSPMTPYRNLTATWRHPRASTRNIWPPLSSPPGGAPSVANTAPSTRFTARTGGPGRRRTSSRKSTTGTPGMGSTILR